MNWLSLAGACALLALGAWVSLALAVVVVALVLHGLRELAARVAGWRLRRRAEQDLAARRPRACDGSRTWSERMARAPAPRGVSAFEPVRADLEALDAQRPGFATGGILSSPESVLPRERVDRYVAGLFPGERVEPIVPLLSPEAAKALVRGPGRAELDRLMRDLGMRKPERPDEAAGRTT